MDYKEIKLNVSNNKIKEYKQFEGLKLYSDIFKSEDEKALINKRIYVTKKQNYVYCKFYRLQREVHLIFLFRLSEYRFARLLLLKNAQG